MTLFGILAQASGGITLEQLFMMLGFLSILPSAVAAYLVWEIRELRKARHKMTGDLTWIYYALESIGKQVGVDLGSRNKADRDRQSGAGK